jgi:hypothetical protein
VPRRTSSKIHRCFAVAASLFATSSCFGSGYEFEGIGAREVSRGGAAIADSPNWTAIYWNPANIQKSAERDESNGGIEIFAGQAHAKDGNSLSSLPVGAIFTKDNLDSGFVLGAASGSTRRCCRASISSTRHPPCPA